MVRKLSINYVFNQFKVIRRYFIKHTIALFLIGIFLGFSPALSYAATYYVSPTGSAAWASCTNINTPCSWQTAMANAVADDIVYFRGGTYSVAASCTGSWEFPAMIPSNSGTLGHPITFIAYPGETPVITPCTASPISPAFGARDRHYIIWDGFSGTMATGVGEVWYFLYWNSTGSIIRNSHFIGTDHPAYNNNAPIRIEQSSNNEIYNNIIHGNTGGVNTSCIWLFSVTYAKIYNNTIYNGATGIMQKDAGNRGNEMYRNFIYSMSRDGIMQNEALGGGDHKIYQNVFLNIAELAIDIYIREPYLIQENHQIYNNTIYSSAAGIQVPDSARNAQVWNNIIYGSNDPFLRYYTGASLPTYSNYNNFYPATTGRWNINYDSNANYTTLSSWRTATGLDVNSITPDPLLINAGGANPADYKLQANSPARTSGRGGSYATVMGAYITGNEIIGYTSDPTLQFSSATYSVSEGTATATITVTRSGSSTGAVTVDYATSNGTATAGSDYTATSGTLNWADGDGTSKTFTVPITNDTTIESDETISLTLSNPTGGVQLGNQSTATLTILDNDGPPILRFENSTYSAGEGAGTVTIRVRRTGSSAGAVSVNYATSNGSATAGSDYTATNGTLNWADGDTATKSFTVSIINDNTVESSETVNITLSNPTNGAQLGSPSSVVLTITDNDSATITPSDNNTITGDTSIGGGGCGFIKDANGQGPKAKGQGLTLMIMLILILAGIAIARRFSNRFSYNL